MFQFTITTNVKPSIEKHFMSVPQIGFSEVFRKLPVKYAWWRLFSVNLQARSQQLNSKRVHHRRFLCTRREVISHNILDGCL